MFPAHLKYFFLIACCILSRTGLSQDTGENTQLTPRLGDEPVRFERITVADGLSNANINASVQDAQGFMWFATHEGLSRYDGYEFTVYRHSEGDSSSLADNVQNDVLVDSNGELWIGTRKGLDRFDPNTEGFVHFRHDPEDANTISDDGVHALAQDRYGNVWVGTRNGVNRFNPLTGYVTRFLYDPEHPGERNSVNRLLIDTEGMVWVGTEKGLNRINPQTGEISRYLHDESDQHTLLTDRIGSIHQDRAGDVWVGTCQGGLHRYDAQSDAFERLHANSGSAIYAPSDDTGIYGYCASMVVIIHQDRSGVYWFGTYNGGFNRFDPRTGRLSHHAHDAANPMSLSDDAVYSIYEDEQGTLWIGTHHGGLNKVDPSRSKIQYHTRDPLSPSALSDKTVWAFEEDLAGSLWLGTARGGLTQIDRQTGRTIHYKHDPEDPRSLSSNWIPTIYEDRAGMLWIGSGGTHQHSLQRFEPTTRTFTHFVDDEVDLSVTTGYQVIDLLEDSRGEFWVSTFGGGLKRFDRSTQAFAKFRHQPDDPNSLSNDITGVLYEDKNGILWIGTWNGLNRYMPETETFAMYLSGFTVMSIFEDANGDLWVGTRWSGIHRFNPSTATSRQYTVDDGLPSNAIACVLGDDSGDLWISTSSKLVRFDEETQTFFDYEIGGGLEHNGYVWNSCYRSSQGELFFGGYEGYISFFPDEIVDNRHPPKVAVTRLASFGETVAKGVSGQEFQFPHNENDLTFDYVGLDYTAPEQIRYRYQLRGYDEEPVEAGIQRSARYAKLPPGEFEFFVTASNGDGVWNEEGASLRIRILPPWWRTWWMFVVYGSLFIVGLVGLNRYQQRRLLRKAREKARARELAHAKEIEEAYHQLEETHANLKTTQQQLIQSEKLASLGQLTAGIAHEIKNPLNFVNNFAELNEEMANELEAELKANRERKIDELLDQFSDITGGLKFNARQIAKHGRRADRIVQAMMQHASNGEGERYEVALNPLVEEFIEVTYRSMQTLRPDLDVVIEKDFDPEAGSMTIAPREIGRVLQNIIGNALDVMCDRKAEQGESYTPRLHVSTQKVDGRIEIRIADNGPGMTDGVKDRIFEPFFTTKPAGSGTGLGLSISYDIVVKGHGGSLAVESGEGEGAAFLISLPVR